jgi:lipopolysaccharide/colanic/teichoic acid biosynthesis glycosyltransferase
MEVSPLTIDLARQERETEKRAVEKVRPHSLRNRRTPEIPPVRASVRSLHWWYLPWKTAIDYGIALVLALLAAPVMALAAALVKLTSRGPAFYSQTRIGRNGRLYTIYKIRTMVHDCESLTGPRWSMPDDPRVTRIGQFLRKTHLDELPQLFNVLRGDMSLIGPRPERPEFLPNLERAIPHYRGRLAVRPGITGLAQVHLAADTDLESVRRKLIYDFHYIRHVNPWLDLRILIATFFYTLGDPLHLTRRITGIPDDGDGNDSVSEEVGSDSTMAGERMCA